MDWIEGLFDTFSDSTFYFIMGSVGSVTFLIKMLLMTLGGDADADVDVNFDPDASGGAGGGFELFSMLSILSFMMGAGWMGLACRQEWGLGSVPSALIASGFGFALMLLSSLLMWQTRKLNEAGGYDLQNCVGGIGRVYTQIPGKGHGTGQVQVAVDGRQKTLPAVSTGEAIASFTTVRVVEIQGGNTVVVEPHQ